MTHEKNSGLFYTESFFFLGPLSSPSTVASHLAAKSVRVSLHSCSHRHYQMDGFDQIRDSCIVFAYIVLRRVVYCVASSLKSPHKTSSFIQFSTTTPPSPLPPRHTLLNTQIQKEPSKVVFWPKTDLLPFWMGRVSVCVDDKRSQNIDRL